MPALVARIGSSLIASWCAAWCASLIGSWILLEIAAVLLMFFGVVVQDLKPAASNAGVLSIVGALLVAPVAETYLLGVLLRSLRGSLTDMRLSALSALCWGALHALLAPFWFFGVVWSFFVYSWFYLLWLPRSQAKAFSAAAVPHMLVNASALVLGG